MRKIKKILSIVFVFAIMASISIVPASADESATSNVIDYAQIPNEMFELFEEHDTEVDENSIVTVVELSDGLKTANGIAVTSNSGEQTELSIFAGLSTDNGSRSNENNGLTSLVERNNNTRSIHSWSYKPANKTVKTTIVYIYNTTSSGIRLYRPQSAEFTVSSTSITHAIVTYMCKGQLYNYPSQTMAGTLYQHNITVSKNNPSANTTYSKTYALDSSYRIAAREGSPLEGCGQYIAVDCTVNGTLYEYTANITYDI